MTTSPAIPQTLPGIASADDGLVILDGPAGIAVTMTADAAIETGRSLLSAAEIARRQRAGNAQNGESS